MCVLNINFYWFLSFPHVHQTITSLPRHSKTVVQPMSNTFSIQNFQSIKIINPKISFYVSKESLKFP